MPATEVTRRAGHGVAVLLKIYPHCIDGQAEFARLSRLSAKALRLHDELGLLPPAQVDPDSGYR